MAHRIEDSNRMYLALSFHRQRYGRIFLAANIGKVFALKIAICWQISCEFNIQIAINEGIMLFVYFWIEDILK